MLTVVPDAQLKEKIVKEKNFEKCWQGANFEIDTFSKKKTLKNVDRVLSLGLPHSLKKKPWKMLTGFYLWDCHIL